MAPMPPARSGQEGRAVAEQKRDAVTGADAVRGEASRQAIDPLGQLGIGQAFVRIDQREAIGVRGQRLLEDGEQARRPLGKAARQTIAEMDLVRIAGRGSSGHAIQVRSASGGVR